MPDRSLKSSDKLKKKWEFRRVYEDKKKYWNNIFTIYVSPNHMDKTRLGLTVSKKVGNSVKRNRVKRLIRESFRLSKEIILPGYDIIVVAKPAAYSLKCQQAQSVLLQLLRRARILKTERDC